MSDSITFGLNVLGPMEVSVGGRPVVIGAQQTRTVLAVLTIGAGSVVPVSRLVDALWPERPPRTAVLKVQGHISALRKLFRLAAGQPAAAALITRQPGYQLDGATVRSDVHDFTELVDRASAADNPHDAAGLLGRALRRWRGPAFADIPAGEVRRHAERLDQLRMLVAEDKAALELRRGRPLAVLEDLGPVVDADPLRERARELLIRAYLGLGQRHAALACYEAGRVQLRKELGINPCSALQRLAAGIRDGDPAQPTHPAQPSLASTGPAKPDDPAQPSLRSTRPVSRAAGR
jgi:DNA-binding SARP family transcriptional activator